MPSARLARAANTPQRHAIQHRVEKGLFITSFLQPPPTCSNLGEHERAAEIHARSAEYSPHRWHLILLSRTRRRRPCPSVFSIQRLAVTFDADRHRDREKREQRPKLRGDFVGAVSLQQNAA